MWDGGQAVHRLGGASTGVLGRKRDIVRPRGAPGWEGGEVFGVGGCSTSKVAGKRGKPVNDVYTSSCIAATNMEDWEAAAGGARGESVVEVGCLPEISGKAGYILGVRVGTQGADGRDHPFVGKEARVAETSYTVNSLAAMAMSYPAHRGPGESRR